MFSGGKPTGAKVRSPVAWIAGRKETKIIDLDLKAYFDSIPQAELLKSVARQVVGGAMLHRIKMWLQARAEETGERGRKHRSTRDRDKGRALRKGLRSVPCSAICKCAGSC